MQLLNLSFLPESVLGWAVFHIVTVTLIVLLLNLKYVLRPITTSPRIVTSLKTSHPQEVSKEDDHPYQLIDFRPLLKHTLTYPHIYH